MYREALNALNKRGSRSNSLTIEHENPLKEPKVNLKDNPNINTQDKIQLKSDNKYKNDS